MYAVQACNYVNSRTQLKTVLIENLMAVTPGALPGGDGLTVDVLLNQYGILAEKGLVPAKRQLIEHHPDLAREIQEFLAG
jgi:hypothetical protein